MVCGRCEGCYKLKNIFWITVELLKQLEVTTKKISLKVKIHFYVKIPHVFFQN